MRQFRSNPKDLYSTIYLCIYLHLYSFYCAILRETMTIVAIHTF